MDDKLAPRPITQALGRTRFKPAAAHWVGGYLHANWSMPKGHRFIIHEAPKREEAHEQP